MKCRLENIEMEYATIAQCPHDFFEFERSFYRMKDGSILCQECLTDQSAVYHDLKKDEIVQVFCNFQVQLRELSSRYGWKESITNAYHSLQGNLIARMKEMSDAYHQEEQSQVEPAPISAEPGTAESTNAEAAPETLESGNWSCARCQFSNLPANQICYKCRASRDGSFAPVYESESIADFNIMTVREGSSWKCKCGRSHPITVQRCECGFLNLALVSEHDSEAEAPSPMAPSVFSAPAVPAMANMLWKCAQCGYEYNQTHSTTCLKCNHPNDAASSPQAAGPMTYPIPSPQAAASKASVPMHFPIPQAVASKPSVPMYFPIPQASAQMNFPAPSSQIAVPVDPASQVRPASVDSPMQAPSSVPPYSIPQQIHVPMLPAQKVQAPMFLVQHEPASMIPSQRIPAQVDFTQQVSASSAQEERKTTEPKIGTNAQIWACSCNYQYNLVTAEKCTRCELANPFLPPKPPSKKCAKCGSREATQSSQNCWQCTADSKFTHSYGISSWTCVPCSTEGNMINRACRKCQRTQEEVYPDLKKVSVPPSPEKPSWACLMCKFGNESSRIRCTKCDYQRILCEKCGTEKNSKYSVCQKCNSQNQTQSNSGQVSQNESSFDLKGCGL